MLKNKYVNSKTGDTILEYVEDNGLRIFICPKKSYAKKIGMIGTVYGSIDTTFTRKKDGKKITVPNGIAHFLEHKLFEQEDGNALDMFAKLGVSSNAYTSYDHTVYFFEADNNYEECIEALIKFINTPYFTDKNVEKEKGIIAQELNMFEDDPVSSVYYNLLKAMYNKFPLNIDIGGTIESVYKITKENLYDCYNTFYNAKNMFMILIGDISSPDKLQKFVMEQYRKYEKNQGTLPTRFYEKEDVKVALPDITKKLDIYMPMEFIGFKLGKKDGKENTKNALLTELISKMYFEKISDFNEYMKNEGLINDEIRMAYESGKEFAHVFLSVNSTDLKRCEEEILKYILTLSVDKVDKNLFKIALNQQKGEMIFESEDQMGLHREIIDSIIDETEPFLMEKIVDTITEEDIQNFIKEVFDMNKMSISRVVPKGNCHS